MYLDSLDLLEDYPLPSAPPETGPQLLDYDSVDEVSNVRRWLPMASVSIWPLASGLTSPACDCSAATSWRAASTPDCGVDLRLFHRRWLESCYPSAPRAALPVIGNPSWRLIW